MCGYGGGKGEALMRYGLMSAILIACAFHICCSDKPITSNGPPVEHLNYVTWDTAFGGWNHDYVTCALADPHGGGIVGGGSSSTGPGPISAYLVFFDERGSYYERSYGGPKGQDVKCMTPVSDGFVTAGYVGYTDWTDIKAWYMKLDWSGNVIWESTYGGVEMADAYSVTTGSDGSIVSTGFTDGYFANDSGAYYLSEELVIMLDPETGEVIRDVDVRDSSFRYLYITSVNSFESGYVLSGWGEIYGRVHRPFLMVLDDTLGVVVRSTPDPLIDGERFDLCAVRWDGSGFITVGNIVPPGQENDQLILIRFTLSGEVDWYKTYGGSRAAMGRSIVVTARGYAAIGYTNPYAHPSVPRDVYFVLTDRRGTLLAEHTYTVEATTTELGLGIDVTTDGGFIIGARTFVEPFAPGDFYVLKTDPYGNLLR